VRETLYIQLSHHARRYGAALDISIAPVWALVIVETAPLGEPRLEFGSA
jgi:hypothetical protein